jgi:hypothetical protein
MGRIKKLNSIKSEIKVAIVAQKNFAPVIDQSTTAIARKLAIQKLKAREEMQKAGRIALKYRNSGR